jgi:polysaccharide export outer membrane protein
MTLAGAVALFVAMLVGCGTDSYFDPSVVGRWERTPTVVPILEHIAAIEGDAGPYVEYSEVSAQDLIPEITEYKVGPGDTLDIVVYDIPQQNASTQYIRMVDERGMIEIPQLGPLYVAGHTSDGVREVISEAMKSLVSDPLASVVVSSRSQQTFYAMGAVSAPGPYFIPKPDYRLLEALTAAGGFSESAGDIYVIRQVPLSSAVEGVPSAPEAAPEEPTENLIDLIDELSEPGGGSPGMVRAGQPDQPEPAIDLIEDQPAEIATQPPAGPEAGSTWMFLNGQWMLVKRAGGTAGVPGAAAMPGQGAEQLVTQRVIRIPIEPLVAGDARYNMVIRAGDMVRVPPAPTGNIFMAGEIGRPGVFQMAKDLTLMRVIDAAGGLSSLAIPERVDLTRMIGRNHQATIQLNLRAINEQTQPDIFLKANDRINVGTHWWAYPLAVFRGGLRANYGFGFLLDRNFGNDIFGAPPSNTYR